MKLFESKKTVQWSAFFAFLSVFLPPIFVSVHAFSLFGSEPVVPPETKTKKIVSILVEKELLGFTGLKRKIDRYAQDVQLAVDAKVVLVPVPKNTSVKELQEGNAALYFSGLKQDNKSQLIGTVLIGDVPLPVVWENDVPKVSAWPYADFEKTAYEWNDINNRFEFVGGDGKPEIWQGLIRPKSFKNDAEESLVERVEKLKIYFDKNNEFHKGKLLYDKRAFHVNFLFQKNGVPALIRSAYENYIKNIEDVVYLRFTKELAKELLTDQKVEDLVDVSNIPGLEGQSVPETDVSGMPDVFSKNVIENLQKRYLQLYEGYVSQLNERVEQTGRWDSALVETTFSLVTKKDDAAAKLLKRFNDAVEQKMFQALADSDIAANVSIPKGGTLREPSCNKPTEYVPHRESDKICLGINGYTRFLYFPEYWNGLKISDLQNTDLSFSGSNPADFCSLLRGGGSNGKIIEFNRTYSFTNINDDVTGKKYFCSEDDNLVRACGQILKKGDGLPQTDQATFEKLSTFDYTPTKLDWADVWSKSDDVKNQDIFYKFHREQSPLFDLSAAKVTNATNIGASGCEDLIWEIQKTRFVSALHPIFEQNLYTFSSLANHIEPTTTTIAAQFKNVTKSPASDLPIDNPRGVSFYDADYEFHRIGYPNVFLLRGQDKNLITGLLNDVLLSKVQQINEVSGLDTDLPSTLLTEVLADFDINALAEALEWIDLPLQAKNEIVFVGALSKVSEANKTLNETDFEGFEIWQMFGESSNDLFAGSIKADFERALEADVSVAFAEAEVLDITFVEANKQKPKGIFDAITATENTALESNDSNDTCNRNLLSWTGSCLLPWLKSLPKSFSKMSQLIPQTNVDGLVSFTVANEKDELSVLQKQSNFSVFPSKIQQSTAGLRSEKFTVTLLDERQEKLEQDFYSSVSVSAPKGLKVHGLKTKKARNGSVDFFITPDENLSAGSYPLKFTVNGKTVSVLFEVQNAEWSFGFDSKTITAGEVQPTVITAWIKNQADEIINTYDGSNVEVLLSGSGSVSNNSLVVKNGKISFLYTPSTKAEKIQIQLNHSNVPTTKIELSVVPNVPEKIFYEFETLDVLKNSVQPQTIKAYLADKFGNKIDEVIDFDWDTEGGRIETINSNTVRLFLNENRDELSLQANTDRLEKKSNKLVLNVVSEAQLVVKKVPQILKAGTKTAQISFVVQKQQKNVPASFSAGIVLDNPAAGHFPKTVLVENGKGEINFVPGVEAGTYTGKILIDGLPSQNFSFEIVPSEAVKIQIDKTNLVRSVRNGRTEIRLWVEDIFGNKVVKSQDEIFVRFNPVDDGDLYVNPNWVRFEDPIVSVKDGNKTFFAQKIRLQDGAASVFVLPEYAGKLFILAQKESFVPATAVLDFTKNLVPDDFNFLNPKALLAFFHGWNSWQWQSPDLSDAVLFNGNVQAVLAETNQADNTTMQGWIAANGAQSPNISSVLQESASPKITLTQNDKTLASLELNFGSDVEAEIVNRFQSGANPGVYIRLAEEKADEFLFQSQQLWYKDTPLLSFRKKGGVLLLHSETKIVATDFWNEFRFEGGSVPAFTIKFVPESLSKTEITLDSSQNSFVFQPLGNSTDQLGIAFFEPNQRSEEPKYDIDTDWVGKSKMATLFAAQNSAGKSWEFSATTNQVLLGDPTVKVQTGNTPSLLGISNDVGTPIWKTPNGKNIQQILVSDINNDGAKEVFSLVGDTLYAQYADPDTTTNYRDTGPILRFADGVKKLAVYEVDNVLAYIVQINTAGQLVLFENQQGALVRQDDVLLPDTVWSDVRVGTLNNDSFEDLVLLDESNTLFVVHGGTDKTFQSPTKLYSFLSDMTTVSERYSPNITNLDDPEQNVFTYLPEFMVDIVHQANQFSTPLLENKHISTEFSLQANTKSFVGAKVKAAIEILPLQPFDSLALTVPAMQGMLFDSASVQCSTCTKDFSAVSADNMVLIENLKGVVGQKQTIEWEYTIQEIPNISYELQDFYGNDGIDDIVVPWKTAQGKRQFVIFRSDKAPKQYPTVFLPPKTAAWWNPLLQKLKAQSVPKITAATINTHAIEFELSSTEKDFSALTETENVQDIANQTFENLTELGFEESSVDSLMGGMSCGAGCGLNIPSYVLMGPGQQALYLPPIALPSIPTLPIPQVGLPALQVIPSIPFVLPFTPTVPASLFRLFVMPSITGQVGIATCLGPQGVSFPPLPVGNCFAFVPPISVTGGSCKSSQKSGLDSLNALFETSNTGSYTPPVIAATKNKKLIAPDIITAWVQAQFEEFSNFKFPAINFVLPDFPKNTAPKNASIWQKLEHSPFVKVERTPIRIQYPSFSDQSFNDLKNSWNDWKNGYETWSKNLKKNIRNDVDLKNDLKQPLQSLQTKVSLSVLQQTVQALPAQIKQQSATLNPQEKERFMAHMSSEIERLQSMVLQYSSAVAQSEQTGSSLVESFNNTNKSLSDLRSQFVVQNPNIELPPKPVVQAPNVTVSDTDILALTEQIETALNIEPVEQFVSDFEKNIETLETYKENRDFLQTVQPKIQALQQNILTTSNMVNDYFEAWKKENDQRMDEWQIFREDLTASVEALQAVPDIFSGLTERCPTCNVNRGTVITWFLKIVLSGIQLPVIPLPKFADTTIDLSNAGIGITIPLPEIELHDTPIDVPNLAKSLPSLNNTKQFLPNIKTIVQDQIVQMPIDVSQQSINLAQNIVAQSIRFAGGNAPNITARGSSVVLDTVNQDFSGITKSVFETLVTRVEIPLSGVLPNMPNVSVLPRVPNFSQSPLNLEIPRIDLPNLPVILPPPIFPNLLKPLQKVLAIPKPFFNLFCYLTLGVIPIPEWKLSSHIQEKTNRFDLIKFLDFVPGALLKSPRKPDIPDKNISFDGVYPKRLQTLTDQLQTISEQSKCSVLKITGKNCTEEPRITAQKNKPKTVVYRYPITKKPLANITQSKSLIAQKKLNLLAQKSEDIQAENAHKILAELNKIPARRLNYLVSRQPVSTQTVQDDLANITASVAPTIEYFDPQTSVSESVIKYKLAENAYSSFKTDINGDNKDDILYSLNNTLLLKYRNKKRIIPRQATVTKWSIDDFINLFVPAKSWKSNTYENGADIELKIQNKNVQYYEWRLSDRPDIVWETQRKPKNRIAKQWQRVGMLVRDPIKKYQIRPVSAQIVKVKGKPQLTAPQKQPLPLFADKAACLDPNQVKPFFASETLLIGTKDNTTFRIETKARNGEIQKSFWKRINKGEEILVDFANVCVISGEMYVSNSVETQTFVPQKGDYFPSGARLVTTANDSVDLLIDGTYEITIEPDETYTIETFKNNTDFVAAFERLSLGNSYGVVQAYQPDAKSATQSKLLHDPQRADDTTAPTIEIKNGDQVTYTVYEPIVLEATDSFDAGGIKSFEWHSDDIVLPNKTNKSVLEIPAQTAPKQFSVSVTVTDFNHNKTTKDVFITVRPPNVSILQSSTNKVVLASDTDKNVPVTLYRIRDGKTTPWLKNVVVTAKNLFEIVPKTQSDIIDVWQKNPRKKIAEVSSTGRIRVLDANFITRVLPARTNVSGRIILKQKNGTTVLVLRLHPLSNQTKNDIRLKDTLSTDRVVWKPFRTTVVGLVGASALVDTKTNTTLAVVDAVGNFYSLDSETQFSVVPSDFTSPLEIRIEKNKTALASFVLPKTSISVQ